ncbi:MAG: sialidase family protein [Actinomycetota bacterium]
MQQRRIVTTGITLVAAAALTGALLVARAAPQAGSAENVRGGNEEAQEQALSTQLREDALAEARGAGIAGKTGRIQPLAAAGWSGEQLFDATGDDWEPAIATDPNGSFAYLLVTRYGGPTACGSRCPSPNLILERSTDNGQTWSGGQFICECRGVKGQFDPIIEVVPNTGHVHAVWMNDSKVVFSKSTDHGATWSTPVKTYGKVQWQDKPVLAMSDDGQHVYVSWNGPSFGDPYVAQSHDAGVTWTQTKIVDSGRYFFAFDADVLPNGTVVFSESSISYTGPGSSPEGPVQQHVLRSTNQGQTWQNVIVDAVEPGIPCVADGCSSDFYLGHSAISAAANGALTLLYDGATTAGGPQRIWVRRSTDGGATWTARSGISTAAEHATSPAVEARGTGDVRAWYMETSGVDADSWNVWYRSSTDGGATWTSPTKISDAPSGADYKDAAGFDEVYGDYGELAITSTGKTIATWGEGFSWTGPGGVWFNRQT